MRKTRNTVPLPTITFANIRSFGRRKGNHQLDSLHANVKFLEEYRNSCILCFTETWCGEETPVENTRLEGFGFPYRLDRARDITGKKNGGGVCIYVNERWCKKNAVIVRETHNTGDVESLTLSFRPDYLPRDFGQIFATLVYLHPNAKEDCVKTVRNTVDNISKIAPSAPHFILGDFNQFNLHKELPNLEQYVTCTTRHDKILDKCYGNVKGAYRSLQRPPVGSADHNAVYMLPQYVKKLKKDPIEIKTIKVWDSDAIERMRSCLETTDWNVLTVGKNVHETADVLSSYIQFCEEVNVHTKPVRIYPNSKPWITKDLKKQINDRNRLFAEGKKVEGKIANKEIKKQIRENKLKNKDKVEKQYFSGDVRNAYKGIKALVGKEDVRERGMGEQKKKEKSLWRI